MIMLKFFDDDILTEQTSQEIADTAQALAQSGVADDREKLAKKLLDITIEHDPNVDRKKAQNFIAKQLKNPDLLLFVAGATTLFGNMSYVNQYMGAADASKNATDKAINLIHAAVFASFTLEKMTDIGKTGLASAAAMSRREVLENAAGYMKNNYPLMAGIGLVSACLTTGFSWMVGLDFALLWGLLAFIMNFIPVLGAMLVLVPPVMVAIMQFDDPGQLWLVISGLGLIQFFMGNVVDPKFQGKFLSMSPVIILLSIAFWSFLWGAPGAFLAVPLTHIVMVTFQQFPNTQMIACMLSESGKREEGGT